MKQTKDIIVIGAGISGLATAALLAKDGFNVTVLEKNSQIGGRARQYKEKEFTFDMGPSWYMMPEAFEKYYSFFNKTSKDFYKLKKLDFHYRVAFSNNRIYDIYSDLNKNIETFEKVEKGAGKKLKEFLDNSEFIYDQAMKELVLLNYTSLMPLISLTIIKNALKFNLFTSFHNEVKKYFKNKDLQKILEFTTVFLGGSPYNTPAFYTLIAHADLNLGIYHPIGGMYKVINALKKLCIDNNVKILTNQNVKKIITNNSYVQSVKTEKETFNADYVVCSADYAFSETNLLDSNNQTYNKAYWNKKTYAPSAFLIYLGIKGKLKNLKHHMLYFDDTWEDHFKTVYNNPSWPKNPSYYLHCPTKTDSTLAPENCEELIVLVPVSIGLDDSNKQREEFAAKIISHIEKTINEKFTDRIIVKKIFSHTDFINDYNAHRGTAFGLAHTLLQTALFRPKNFSKKVKGLYYTGQYTNPGIGVPICLLSSQITAKLVKSDYDKHL